MMISTRRLTLALAICGSLSASVADAGDRAGSRSERRQEALEKFDVDQSGDLDANEWDALRSAVRKKVQERIKSRRGQGQRLGPRSSRGRMGGPAMRRFGPPRGRMGSRLGDGRARRFGGAGRFGRRAGPPAGESRSSLREKFMQKFDANSDGELSQAEREVARSVIKKRLEERRGR